MTGGSRNREFTPLIPQGVQCYFGEEVAHRRRVEAVLAGVMRAWGFQEIILPFFDYLESFAYGLGSALGDRTYRFLDRDGALLALRPDLTTLVAKTVATRMTGQSLPIQLFYSGQVFRHERARAGAQREYYQIGLESMGEPAGWSDTEVLLIVLDSLRRVGVSGFKIALGHVGLFQGIVERLGLSAERAAALRDAIDHKDGAWLAQEVGALGLPPDKERFLVELPGFVGGSPVLARALEIVENPRSRQALVELQEIDAVLGALGVGDAFTFDLSEVRGLDYYTGIVFKIYARAAGGELGGGGRYDGLLGNFGWDLPAVGFSFTLDRLLPLVPDASALALPDGDGEPYVLRPEGAPQAELFGQAWSLRERGVPVRIGRGGAC